LAKETSHDPAPVQNRGYGTQKYRNIVETFSDDIKKIKAQLEFKLARVIKKSF